MTIVREEENGNNGHHAGDVWRGGRCPSSLDSLAGALARFGRIDRSIGRSPCARRSDRPKHPGSDLAAPHELVCLPPPTQLANGCRSQVLRCRRTDAGQRRPNTSGSGILTGPDHGIRSPWHLQKTDGSPMSILQFTISSDRVSGFPRPRSQGRCTSLSSDW
jgi:hypothetical protein